MINKTFATVGMFVYFTILLGRNGSQIALDFNLTWVLCGHVEAKESNDTKASLTTYDA